MGPSGGLSVLAQQLSKRRFGRVLVLRGARHQRASIARMLARMLGYRIVPEAVISKFIGETEKNLARIVVAADRPGALLFFDEADALFGKRTSVKDSHDRFASLARLRGVLLLGIDRNVVLPRPLVRRSLIFSTRDYWPPRIGNSR